MVRIRRKRREKLPLRKIENKHERLIAFTKRRLGIYKKASELVTLSRAEIAILTFLESGKPYTYGAPNFETVKNWYRGLDNPSTNSSITNSTNFEKLEELNEVHDELCSRLKIVKKEGEEISKAYKPMKSEFWWEAPLEDLTPQQMDQLIVLMEKISAKASERIEELSRAT